MSDPIRVLIVDDSAFIRRAVERMLSVTPEVRVVAAATDGKEAVELACTLKPDVIVMDVNMPQLNGLDALRRIMAECPTAVLMMSTVTRAGADITLEALEIGAVDFIDKSAAGTIMDIYTLAPVLREKVIAVARAGVPGSVAPVPEGMESESGVEAPVLRSTPATGNYEVIAIGASTGGPRALSEILPRLPGTLTAGVVVAQHMPSGFTETLAERLNMRCPLHVAEAKDGDPVEPGQILIAPGGKQIRIERQGKGLVARVSTGPRDLLHRPSVDGLLKSVASTVGSRGIGVVLTGMGEDGAQGLKLLREAGGRTIAESADTAVIYGMPRAAKDAAEQILPLGRIASVLTALCANSHSQPRET